MLFLRPDLLTAVRYEVYIDSATSIKAHYTGKTLSKVWSIIKTNNFPELLETFDITLSLKRYF